MKKIIIALMVVFATINANAADVLRGALSLINESDVNVRLGYNLGGTAPMGMPATIRGLNTYKLQFNPSLGIDVAHPLQGNWFAVVGLQLENKGMEMDARVKNYHMVITRGGQTLGGVFTGDVTTRVTQWMLTLPAQIAYKHRDFYFKFGPYVSYVGNRNFGGWAHNGYLRVDDPTGDKVLLGDAKDERGDYDFTPDMRRLQVGFDAGVDWHFHKRFGAFVDLAWGISQVHRSSFHTIEQTLYPVYGKLGFTYRIK